MSLTIGSLCTGYGGLDLAVESALGARTAWVSDIDKGACKVLAHRFPDAPNIGDMTTVDWAAVEPVDVITGGTPCQDLSHAGKRAGMTEGTRSNLWVAMREAIATIRPRLVIWENVGGAYSAAADSEMERREGRLGGRPGRPALRALGRVLGDLDTLGYVGGWHGLRAADIGAPHGRLRVFVVAWDAQCGGCVWNERTSRRDAVQRTSPQGSGQGALLPSPRTSDTNGAGQHGDGGLDLRTVVSLLPTPRATDGTKGGPNQRGSSGDLMLPSAVAMLPTPQARDWKGYGPADGERHDPNLSAISLLLPTPTTMDGHSSGGGYNGQENVTLTDATARQGAPHVPSWGQYARAIARWEAVTRPAPSPVIVSETYKARIRRRQENRDKRPVGMRGPLGYLQRHQLSPLFTEWMMGLPVGWITDVPDVTRNEALKLCGNGVVPQQAEAAIRFLLPLIARAAA